MRLSVAVSPDWIWAEDVLQLGAGLDPGVAALVLQPQAVLAGLADGAGGLLVGGGPELVAGLGHRRQAEHLDRRRRAGRLDLLALVVDHRPDPAPGGAGDDRVADLELALVDEHRGHGAAADVEVGLEHDALGPPVGLAVSSSSSATTSSWSSRSSMPSSWVADISTTIVSPPHDSGTRLVLGELGEDPLRVGVVLVDLVDGHDDRHLGRLGVVDRLDRLGHHAVVGGDDEHDDVGGLGAAGPHLR